MTTAPLSPNHVATQALIQSADRKVASIRDFVLEGLQSGRFSWDATGYIDYYLVDNAGRMGIGGHKPVVMSVYFRTDRKRPAEAHFTGTDGLAKLMAAEGDRSAVMAHFSAQELLNELRALDRKGNWFELTVEEQSAHMMLRAEALSRMSD